MSIQMIVYNSSKGYAMKHRLMKLLGLAVFLAGGCDSPQPTNSLKSGQEQKQKEKLTKTAPND